VRAHLPLAVALARRYGSETEGADDLAQVAAVGLVKAARRFDPARGAPFAAFAVPTILGELRHHLRDRGWPVRMPRTEPGERARLWPRAVPLPDEAQLAAPDELEGTEDRLFVESLLARLRRKERLIVRRYFLQGCTQVEVARELGVSQMHVSRMLRRALESLRTGIDADAA
jgi:RNA polymerase sigma-B factor